MGKEKARTKKQKESENTEMNEEKQNIEAMAKDVANSISWCEEVIPEVDCLGTAASLYGIGYRKQSGSTAAVLVPSDDIIFAIAAIAQFCISLTVEEDRKAAEYRVDNNLLGKRKIRLSEALWQVDRWLRVLAEKRLEEMEEDPGNERRETAIKEMAKIIDRIESNAYIECFDSCEADADKIAEVLYDSGYRKQSED